jgi:hypothetical protein
MDQRSEHSQNLRFMLCRPRGGLNDALAQMFLCYLYAKKHHRTLIIDSTFSGFYLPFDTFFELLETDPSVKLSLDDDLRGHLNTLTCAPAELQGRISSFMAYYCNSLNGYRDALTHVSTCCDFTKPAAEELVVHENAGGGKKSRKMLGLLRLRPSIAEEINRRLAVLPHSYVAVQIRNTDMRTNYLAFFEKLRPALQGKTILLCSDDDEVKAQASQLFGADRVVSLRQFGGFNGQPLHLLGSDVDVETKYNLTLDALTDLMAMGLARAVHVPLNIEGGVSGFGQLGRLLQADKSLVHQLLHRPAGLSMRLNRYLRQKIHLLPLHF